MTLLCLTILAPLARNGAQCFTWKIQKSQDHAITEYYVPEMTDGRSMGPAQHIGGLSGLCLHISRAGSSFFLSALARRALAGRIELTWLHFAKEDFSDLPEVPSVERPGSEAWHGVTRFCSGPPTGVEIILKGNSGWVLT